MIRYIINWLFPKCCAVCGKQMLGDNPVCKDCESTYMLTENKAETRGGLVTNHSVYCYDGAVKTAIQAFKFNKQRSMDKYFAKKMIERIGIEFFRGFDYMVPVPLHDKRFLERGYNQSELLSVCISEITGVPNINALLRIKYTACQYDIEYHLRAENVKDAFDVAASYRDVIRSKRLLIIDDVITSGSTINECAKILNEHGAITTQSATLSAATKKHRA